MKLITKMPLHNDGDVRIFQTGMPKTAVSDPRVIANYSRRSDFLIHAILYFLQIGYEVPYKTDWNQRFYQGLFQKPGKIPPLMSLCTIVRGTEQDKKLIKLAREVELAPINPVFTIQNTIHSEDICPIISSMGNLVYLNERREIRLLFDNEGAVDFHRKLLDQLCADPRGQRREIGIVYSHFPFEAYEKEFSKTQG